MIISVLNNIEVLHKMFPYLKKCDVVWMELLKDGSVNLFGYDQNNFAETFSDQKIWPKTKYSEYMLDQDNSCYLSDIDKNPINTYNSLLRDLKLNKILK